MKVEFRNTPVFYGSSAFSEVSKQNTLSNTMIPPKNLNEPKSDEVVLSNRKKALIGTAAAVLIGGAVWLINSLRGRGKVQNIVAITPENTGDVLKTTFKKTMEAFPDDFAYINVRCS